MDELDEDDLDEASNLLSDPESLAKTINGEKKKNPGLFVSHWEEDENNIEVETEEDRKKDISKKFLHLAEKGDLEEVKKLFGKHPEILNSKDKDGYTALHRASYEGHLPIVKYLIAMGANINSKSVDGWTPLHSACFWSKVEVVTLLLRCKDCHVNTQTTGKQTPLHLAAQNSSCLKLFKTLLLNPQVDPCLSNNLGEVAGDLASRHFKYHDIFNAALSHVNHLY